MRKCLYPAILFLFFAALSCDLLRDSPYEVEAWSPGEGYHSDPARIKVSLLLSHESDRAKTEQAFSISEDRKTMKGNFAWEGARLVFIPSSPWEANRDYRIALGTGAQDQKGLSLENKFEAIFSTRPPGSAPGIIGIEPEYEACLSGNRDEVRLYFSDAVSLNSCIDSISFSPSIAGSWRLEDENCRASFLPKEPWHSGTLYRIRVDSGFTGISGAALGVEYSSLFYGGPDNEKPVLLNVRSLYGYGEAGSPGVTSMDEIPFGTQREFPPPIYTSWERSSILELVFSKPVDLSGINGLLAAEPAVPLIMESLPEFSDRALFRLAEYPQWGSHFLFRLSPGLKDAAGNLSADEYIFRIAAAGPLSKPPSLVGMRLPMAPGNIDHEALSYSQADLFADLPIESGEGRYPFNVSVPVWIELYFETAPDTEIDPFSLMDLFSVEPINNALKFSPRSISADSFSCASPREGWEDFQRLEIRGFLSNLVQSGIVRFCIAAGLADKRGNRNSQEFRISLLK